jgi:hypothetical protein
MTTDATQDKGVSQQGKPAAPYVPESNVSFVDNPGANEDNSREVSAETQEATRTEPSAAEQPRNPRDDVIDDIHAKIEAARQEELAQAVKDGLQAPAQPAATPEPAPDAKPGAAAASEGDDLDQFVVVKDGKRLFRTVVNGKEVLIPPKRAQEQLQKAEAAEVRMARAAEYERGLKVRENQILAREQALTTGQPAAKPATPSGSPDEGDRRGRDEEILRESRELVSSLFTGNEEQAAAKLAKVLTTSRGIPTQAPVNPEEIARRAAAVVRQELSEEDMNKDIVTGYAKLGTDYPEVMTDSNLHRYADSLTTTIAEEHPEWKPSEVMLEAGKRTREWVESLKTPETTPQKPPANPDRQARKGELVPLPRQTSVRRETPVQETTDDTPQSLFADIRRSRGQAV